MSLGTIFNQWSVDQKEALKEQSQTITFWKDNRNDGIHEIEIKAIIERFVESEISGWDQPFERKILNFISEEGYGTFELITDIQWGELSSEYKSQR